MTAPVWANQSRQVAENVDPATDAAFVDMNSPPAPILTVEWVADVAARVDGAPDVGWLMRPVWPADAYGVLGAEKKAGKTWLALDLAVSVASGTPWIGSYPCETTGPVLLFLGEGGERKMLRRLRAVARSRNLSVEDLAIRLCHRVPALSSVVHLGEIEDELAAHRPVLVIVDPLYLAAGNAKGSDLYSMGGLLAGVQQVCQRHNAALAIVTHWNKTGDGNGSHRMTGVGPAEWGRVLVSVGVEQRSTLPDRSTVATLHLVFEGDEIPETEMRLKRHIAADDPDDLTSPLTYDVEVLGAPVRAEKWDGPTQCMEAIAHHLASIPGVELSGRQLGDQLRDAGKSYRHATVADAAERLASDPASQIRVRIGPRKSRLYTFLETSDDPIF